MIKYFKKGGIALIFAVILLVGVFLRGYHFSDWLHFELDQARDAKVVDLAVENGIGNLPLLGPKAAGSFLRLGPIFYYFEYLSAKIFGDTPSGMAYLSLFFSILTLPMFYLFVKRYFSQKISLALLFLFSVSLFLTMYSRFAWNPNDIPFFSLLAFYALLRATDREEPRRGVWLILFAMAISIVTQLHFLAFIAVPLVSLAFLIIKRPKIKPVFWAIAISIVIFFYIPPIINDLKTGGENIKEFHEIFIKKSTKDTHSLAEKIYRNYAENSIGYLLLISSYQEAEFPKVEQEKGLTFDLKCAESCRKNLPGGVAALAFMSLGLILLVLNLKKHYRKKDYPRSDFLLLVILWFVVTFALYLPIAFDISPRFFLLSAPLPFIFVGFILKLLGIKRENKYSFAIFLSIVLLLGALNLSAVQQRFSEMKKAPTEAFDIKSDKILKERDRITLEQQYLITDYIEDAYRKNNYPAYLNSEAFYRRSLLYHLEKRAIPNDDFRNASSSKKVYRNGNYFLIYPTMSNLEERKEDYVATYDIVETKQFGTLTVFRLVPKSESVNAIQQEFGPKKKAQSATGVPVRCRWNEIFKVCNPDEVIGEEEGQI